MWRRDREEARKVEFVTGRNPITGINYQQSMIPNYQSQE
jgi:hypothetical protein